MRVPHPLLTAILFAAIAAPVSADPNTTSRLGWVTNGDVQAAVQVGNTLYIGGTFTRVAPASNALGSFFGVSAVTGEPLPLFPLVDGVVHTVEPDDAGGYYIGGAFTTVGGVARTHIAHVLAGGVVDPNFTPTISGGPVATLALGSAGLFIGGTFTNVNSVPLQGFALLNPATGATIVPTPPAFADVINVNRMLIAGANLITVFRGTLGVHRVHAFDQTTGATVWATMLSTSSSLPSAAAIAGSRLILGGTKLDGDRPLVSLDLATGAIDPTWIPSESPSSDTINALAVSGTTLYVGGRFTQFGNQPRTNAAAVDIPTGTVTAWAPSIDAAVDAVATTPGGTVIVGGRFTQVDGAARDTLAEVDAGGNVTPWVPDTRAATVQKLLVEGAGALIVGGQVGVAGGSARTNLAAFDLSSDTLLPWAPATADDVTSLAAIGSTIYIGASRLVAGSPTSRLDVVSAVDGMTGAALPWTPPASTAGVTLLGTVGPHVYLGLADPFGPRSGLIRVDPTTAAIDPSWHPRVTGGVKQMVVSGTTMFIGGSFGAVQGQGRYNLAALDLATGMLSPWNQTLLWNPAGPLDLPFRAFAIDGRTLYVAYDIVFGSIGESFIATLDSVSGFGTVGRVGGDQPFGPIGIADGQLIVGRETSPALSPNAPLPPSPGKAVQAFTADGQTLSWSPGYTRIKLDGSMQRPAGLVVTPTDLILLGYNGASPVPVQGVAVLPRTPSSAPTSLRATTVDNQVTLTWDPPSAPPTNGYVVDVGAESGSHPLTLPTGSQATTITAAAGDGMYFVRVRAADAPAGPASLPTNEIALLVRLC